MLAAYFPALKAGYIWDDKQGVFLGNPQIESPNGWRTNWSAPQATDYLPVTFDSFWIEWQLWGDSPAGYHATNVLLHIANCLLIWRLLALLEVPGAWLGALLFAIHPVNVASVAWIAERKNVLSTFLRCVRCWPTFVSIRQESEGCMAYSFSYLLSGYSPNPRLSCFRCFCR